MVSLGSGLQLSIVNQGGHTAALVIEEVRPGGDFICLGSATKQTIEGLRFCLKQIEGMCNP